jgi:hypothetical protein
MPRVLTDPQVMQFREQGFVSPLRVMSVEAAAAVRDALETYERSTGGPLRGPRRLSDSVLTRRARRGDSGSLSTVSALAAAPLRPAAPLQRSLDRAQRATRAAIGGRPACGGGGLWGLKDFLLWGFLLWGCSAFLCRPRRLRTRLPATGAAAVNPTSYLRPSMTCGEGVVQVKGCSILSHCLRAQTHPAQHVYTLAPEASGLLRKPSVRGQCRMQGHSAVVSGRMDGLRRIRAVMGRQQC